MSALLTHAKAARILGESIANRAQQMGDPTGLLTCLADAHLDAAARMTEQARSEASGPAYEDRPRAPPRRK
jgi:hypothetical protein